MQTIYRKRLASSAAAGIILGMSIGSAKAAPVITSVNADLSVSPYSFSYLGSTFTFTGTGGFPNYLAVSTSGSAAVRTVFGTPSTDFTDRGGPVVYDQNTLGGFGSFPVSTSIPYTNGDNFLGLRVTSAGKDYYGFAFSTNAVLNSYGFETSADTGITATTATGTGTVPEPASWALMVAGFGLVGVTVRRRQRPVIHLA
ncbi:PEPxxWA-CTERM sorting domain-containing protein (plasmid) [Polymorphobacter sp. PAMC 29334]|uniref:PEPxxWA-CTERM sorting domain-containing protein n=1 Tax=Polymorphobacter sp. PAMC 29334 TaxID=2862331 RepID=UPI001C774AFB|nr:PEPxxWA-CTERM sorting domain-containing protein [Polymorphobacter sp. PAMC 29334]QYE37158.1 PEPxxWA-CTERM sorting domain-containing protein [Polymorphobacter sp. PAMC 29334]